MEQEFYSEWYEKNRERLLPIRRKYNEEYTKRPEVIARAKIKNQLLRGKRAEYKKTEAGKLAEKRYRENHRDQIKNRSQIHRLRRYGLSPGDTDRLLKEQAGLCRICNKDIKIKFHIDHCHETNRVRGLLCTPCNMGLGLFKDNIVLLGNAIEYLK